ncbi:MULTISPECIES: nucleotidyltransferase family protein [Rhodomicrobium]|uniref:nucleotidyltransferase family protein n=1 Tax=Rhodomicrobium TaxID=1068 RepID=UPI000B4B09C8|nr:MULTISPECIES: nucleotidyltransferase family protein [Rhodomicrobium]
MSGKPTRALVLAAGLGQRMQPLTDKLPKPLVRLGGRPLLDHVLERLAAAGIGEAVVNVHYLPEQIEAHLRNRTVPRITISDERAQILDTGGAVKKALPLLGDAPFLVHNSDSVWIERQGSTLARMIDAWNPETMDSLLLLAPVAASLGYDGSGDFAVGEDGRVRRRQRGETVPYVFAGVSINQPHQFADCPDGAFSLNRVWDEALAAGRLASIAHDGLWMHVGTPAALADAERCLDGLNAA